MTSELNVIGAGSSVLVRVDENKDGSQEFSVTEALGFEDVPDGEYLFIRVVPDVPELVRYDCVSIGGCLAEMHETSHGDYVRYDQAAAVIAALKSELYDMRVDRDLALKWRDHDKQRAEAAEAKLAVKDGHIIDYKNLVDALHAKLAQSEKQEAYGNLARTNLNNVDVILFKPYNSDFLVEDGMEVYTAPVASDAVWPEFKAPNQYDDAPPSWDDPALPNFKALWEIARKHGYAVGLHGSMRRDCDLIAAPWVDGAAQPQALIAALCNGLNAKQVGETEQKPLGRIAVSLQIDGWFKVIDLSVMSVAGDADLRAENDKLRQALRFYADVSKYPAPLTGGMGALWADCGEIALAALNPSETRT